MIDEFGGMGNQRNGDQLILMDKDVIELAAKAVQIYAESHPRPPHVNQMQAAQMLGKSHVTVRKMIRAGLIRLNACGDIPISEIDRVLAAQAA